MRILFRVDASPRIGSGHLTRCLALAERLRQSRCEILLVCRRDRSGASDLIRRAGFDCRLLPEAAERIDSLAGPPHRDWLGARSETDFEQTVAEMHGAWSRPDLVVVDHYGIDAAWECQMRTITAGILVIDDLADRRHDCTLLVDQTYGRSAKDYQSIVPADCRLLVGSEFALLRDEFTELRPMSLTRRETTSASRLLVAMGGYDPQNLTSRVLSELATVPMGHATVDVVLGRGAPHLQSVARMCDASPYRATLSVDVADMACRMAKADLAIGSSGTISWERCCLGLPAVVITFARNQHGIARALSEAGAIRYLGDADTVIKNPGCIAATIAELSDDGNARRLMGERAAAIVDGKGSERVARVLLEES
jgi:UDP-2,4-diacetamido-2,4,6-trideoxy-beta-L-altropyranose hydrolase